MSDTRQLAWVLAILLPVSLPAAPPAGDNGILPDNLPYEVVDGVRFYSQIAPQPWRDHDDVIEGFDWSLPDTAPSPKAMFRARGQDPKMYPVPLLGNIMVSWRELEPEEGRYDFGVIAKKIEQRAAEGYRRFELHLLASIWAMEFVDSEGKIIPPEKLNEKQQGQRSRAPTAPAWLAQYNIPTKSAVGLVGEGCQITNFDIFHPAYHSRYLKLIRALGETGIPQRPDLLAAYVHIASFTRGEEGEGDPPGQPHHKETVERLQAWADAFKGNCGKLMFLGNNPDLLRIAYSLGMGQRNGYVERYLLHTHNPALGQTIDTNGYLVVDESLPPIAENRVFGDENEEYDAHSEGWVARFGPRESWPHRYREATFRQLQMRRNYVWEPVKSNDPYLTYYLACSLGRTIADTADAWCYLRESYVHENNVRKGKVVPVKNFERWLLQRDSAGYETEPAHKIIYPPTVEGFIRTTYVKGYNYDYVARKGKRFGFALDDRFLPKPAPVAIKVTYYDEQPWKLVYPTATGPAARSVPCRGDGALRTATFFLADAVFAARKLDYDFEIQATSEPATIRFVRVIKFAKPQSSPRNTEAHESSHTR
ncbi:MAG: hypothetical protein PCFJNLEI_00562 [Verrucomicrobiae bacterium]|nr:hypothetical protein [Verrucomicrobiae bacterium]